MTGAGTWHVVVPMKDTRHSKTRMPGTPGQRRQLTILMARDTLCAIAAAKPVSTVTVVCDRDEDVESFGLPGVHVVVRSGFDLNPAIEAGVALIRGIDPDANVVALPGDLPYLRAGELEAALGQAEEHPRTVIADYCGTGTTLLGALGGVALDPHYGADSLIRHRESGAYRLPVPVWSGLRRDADSIDDLVDGPALGARTREFLRRWQATRVKELVG